MIFARYRVSLPWQFRRLDFIGQFTSDVGHISRHQNIVEDVRSHVDSISESVTTQSLATIHQTAYRIAGNAIKTFQASSL